MGSICGPIAGGFMGNSFFKLYESQVSPWLFVSSAPGDCGSALVIATCTVPSARLSPSLRTPTLPRHGTRGSPPPTGSMPILLPEGEDSRSTRVVNRLTEDE